MKPEIDRFNKIQSTKKWQKNGIFRTCRFYKNDFT